MYHLTCTSICCSQPFQPNKSSSGWQPYLKCRRAFDIIYISIPASLFCHATIQSSVCNLAHASLETAVNTTLLDFRNPTASALDEVSVLVSLHSDKGLVKDGRLGH